jgi:heavy metal translocating P-type ATPase
MEHDGVTTVTQSAPKTWTALLRPATLVIAAVALAVGLFAEFTGASAVARVVWISGIAPVLTTLLAEIFSSLRRGEVGLDVVAALSMGASIAFNAPLAGIVVALMYSGGQYLEAFAEGRARREMTALLGRVARTAMRFREGSLEETPIEAIRQGDSLLIRSGEVVPVDGITADPAILDESTLTGESLPVERPAGAEVLSGTTSVGTAFTLTATRPAAESAYARIVQLVAAAQRSKAPMSRLADRFAIIFLVVTLAVAGGAWLVTGNPLRALAVLVVATPCPLILAVPVAIVSGVSRCAKAGLLVKGGAALEALARVRVVVLDKTGTLTEGQAALAAIHVTDILPADEVLRQAASLDQASNHVVAEAIVTAARERGLRLSLPTDIVESPGTGIEGTVEGCRVVVGGRRFVQLRAPADAAKAAAMPSGPGVALTAVAVDGRVVGALSLTDRVRPEAAAMLRSLRRLGVRRMVLASGDAAVVAQAVAGDLGVDGVQGDLAPEQKVALVLAERRHGPVLMVGDGVNDAPALAAADVGVALGVRGAAASSEVADAVLLVDRIDPLAAGIAGAQRARQVALQSVVVGIGLSFLAMGFAALGYLSPIQGALVQEAIDVAVIANALRPLADRPLLRLPTDREGRGARADRTAPMGLGASSDVGLG